MIYPESIINIINDVVDKNPDDIDKAVKAAFRRVKNLPVYKKTVDELVQQALRELIHDRRHKNNKIIRRQSSPTGQQSRQVVSNAGTQIYNDCYLYSIAGMSLGSMTKDDLDIAIETEQEKIKGLEFNVKLCQELSMKVKPGRTVRQSVKKADLEKIFAKCA